MNLRNIFSRLSNRPEQNRVLVTLYEEPSQEEHHRAENFQLGVVTVILSILATQNNQASSTAVNRISSVLLISSTIFLGSKLILSTIRPYRDSSRLRFIDYAVLPALFWFSFLIGMGILALPLIIESILVIFPFLLLILELSKELIVLRVPASTLIWMGVIIATILSVWLAIKTGKSMSVIDTGIPEVKFTITSGASDSSIPIRLKNPTKKDIEPNEIKINIYTEEGIEVADLRGASKEDENSWRPFFPISSEGGVTLELDLEKDSGADIVQPRTVRVEVILNGKTQQKHDIKIEA